MTRFRIIAAHAYGETIPMSVCVRVGDMIPLERGL